MITFRKTAEPQTPRTSTEKLNRKILITGGDSALARYLAHGLLDSGAQVSVQCVGAEAYHTLKENFPCVQLSPSDFRFGETLSIVSPDVILHIPADVQRGTHNERPMLNFNRTIDKVVQLCESVWRNAPQAHLMYMSTTDVYGECPQPKSESSELTPVSKYGSYSVMAEQILNDFGTYHGLRTSVLRLSSTYGPGLAHGTIAELVYNLLGPQGTNMHNTFDMNSTRDIIHAGDVLQALNLILSKDAEGVFNVASGHSMHIRELHTHLCAILELNAAPRTGKPDIAEAVQQRFDIAKLIALGFEPQVPLIEGLRGYTAWWSGIKAA